MFVRHYGYYYFCFQTKNPKVTVKPEPAQVDGATVKSESEDVSSFGFFAKYLFPNS